MEALFSCLHVQLDGAMRTSTITLCTGATEPILSLSLSCKWYSPQIFPKCFSRTSPSCYLIYANFIIKMLIVGNILEYFVVLQILLTLFPGASSITSSIGDMFSFVELLSPSILSMAFDQYFLSSGAFLPNPWGKFWIAEIGILL